MNFNTSEIIALLSVLVLFLFLLCLYLLRKLRDVHFAKRSLSSKYGKTTEQFMPFLANYPYDSGNFRFIGTPIDGIQFNDDKIVFVEFKTGSSKLSPKQLHIKNLVLNKKISWLEFKI